eukprot:gene950-33806_t
MTRQPSSGLLVRVLPHDVVYISLPRVRPSLDYIVCRPHGSYDLYQTTLMHARSYTIPPSASFTAKRAWALYVACLRASGGNSDSEDKDSNLPHPEFNSKDELWTLPGGWSRGVTLDSSMLECNAPSFINRSMWSTKPSCTVDLLSSNPSAWLQKTEGPSDGIYSLRGHDDDGMPQETILVFEREEDAVRFANQVEAGMAHAPKVCKVKVADIKNFCKDHGYQCRLESAGSLFLPPDLNVGDTDWERANRLRSGSYELLVKDEGNSGSNTTSTQPSTTSSTSSTSSTSRTSPHDMPSMTEADLMSLRNQFERLLPPNNDDGSLN